MEKNEGIKEEIKEELIEELTEEIAEPGITTIGPEVKNDIAKNRLGKTEEVNGSCCVKLDTLHYWESIKRIGMMHLLEEVIKVQGMEKTVIRIEKEKQMKSEHGAENADENSRENYENDDDDDGLSEDNDTKELAAADKSIENLKKTTFNSQYKFEEIYELMIKFAKPCMDAEQAMKAENLQMNAKIPKHIIKRDVCTTTTKKRKRSFGIADCSTPILRNKNGEKQHKRPNLPYDDGKSAYITIGANGTKISRNAFNTVNWSLSGPAITRKILMEVFDRHILAFHTLTGKPSPAFTDYDMPKKNQLDSEKVADIIEFMMKHFDMTSREVRSAITTKCADENKMHRQRQLKMMKTEVS